MQAEKLLKKLERDYLHAKENYEITQWQWDSFYSEALRNKNRLRKSGHAIDSCKRLEEKLRKALDKITATEATPKPRETDDRRMRISILRHKCKTLVQEKTLLLHRKTECEKPGGDDLIRETIDFKRVHWEFDYIKRTVPGHSSKRTIHALLREIKETKKTGDKAIANGSLVDEPRTRISLVKTVQNEIMLLSKVIRELVKERIEREEILRDERMINKDYAKRAKNMEDKCEQLRRRREEHENRMLESSRKQHNDMKK